jgi:hypothetical protein
MAHSEICINEEQRETFTSERLEIDYALRQALEYREDRKRAENSLKPLLRRENDAFERLKLLVQTTESTKPEDDALKSEVVSDCTIGSRTPEATSPQRTASVDALGHVFSADHEP